MTIESILIVMTCSSLVFALVVWWKGEYTRTKNEMLKQQVQELYHKANFYHKLLTDIHMKNSKTGTQSYQVSTTITYWWSTMDHEITIDPSLKKRLDDHAETRIFERLYGEGETEGELIYEDENITLRGYWSVKKSER